MTLNEKILAAKYEIFNLAYWRERNVYSCRVGFYADSLVINGSAFGDSPEEAFDRAVEAHRTGVAGYTPWKPPEKKGKTDLSIDDILNMI